MRWVKKLDRETPGLKGLRRDSNLGMMVHPSPRILILQHLGGRSGRMRNPKSSSNVHTKVRGQHACDLGMELKLSGLNTSIFAHCDILMIQEEVTVISFMMSLHHDLITHGYHHSIFLLRYLSDLIPLSWTGEH